MGCWLKTASTVHSGSDNSDPAVIRPEPNGGSASEHYQPRSYDQCQTGMVSPSVLKCRVAVLVL
jgi:hypothetical protein